MNNASDIRDLAAPPGNRLDALKGDWRGRYSIRVDGQWRLVFRWGADGPEDVEVVDYHRE